MDLDNLISELKLKIKSQEVIAEEAESYEGYYYALGSKDAFNIALALVQSFQINSRYEAERY